MRTAFDSAQPGEPEESFRVPPVTAELRGKALVEQLYFLPGDLVIQREIRVGAGHVAVPFGNLVGKVQLVAERRRHKLANGSMILVRVSRRWREHEVRGRRGRDGLNDALDLPVYGRKAPIGQVMRLDLQVGSWRERPGRGPGLRLPLRRAGQQHVPDAQPRVTPGQGEQRAARSDLDIVWMRADGDHRQRPALRRAQRKRNHAWTTRVSARTSVVVCPDRS